MSEPKPHLGSPISSQKNLLSGITLCVIAACVKPDIILILSAIFAKFAPGACKLNNDVSERRKLIFFEKDADKSPPKEWKDITFNNYPNNYGIMKEEYWVNKRLLFIYFKLTLLFRTAEQILCTFSFLIDYVYS